MPQCSTLVSLINEMDKNTGMFTETKVFVTIEVESCSVPANTDNHF